MFEYARRCMIRGAPFYLPTVYRVVSRGMTFLCNCHLIYNSRFFDISIFEEMKTSITRKSSLIQILCRGEFRGGVITI